MVSASSGFPANGWRPATLSLKPETLRPGALERRSSPQVVERNLFFLGIRALRSAGLPEKKNGEVALVCLAVNPGQHSGWNSGGLVLRRTPRESPRVLRIEEVPPLLSLSLLLLYFFFFALFLRQHYTVHTWMVTPLRLRH